MFSPEYVEARWLLFLATPCRKHPEADGSFDLGEVGEAPEKNWDKATPYSPAMTVTVAPSLAGHTPGMFPRLCA
jgi:hypothetical protein